MMGEVRECLVFLIPIIVIEVGLLAFTVRHILTHEQYKMGNRIVWLAITIVGFNFVGPVLYFLLGREDG